MIACGKSLRLGLDQKLIIVPLSDIHWNAPAFDREKWTSTIAWIAETAKRPDRQVLTLLMGDYLDTFSGSERRALSGASLHSSSRARMEQMLRDDLGGFVDDLQPIKETIATVVEGNHCYKFQETDSGPHVGKTTGRVLAEILGAPYLGICGFLGLSLTPGNSTGKRDFKIYMHHGFGMASNKGTSINQIIQKFTAIARDGDCYIMGHNHVPICTTLPGIGHYMVRAGSRRKGYYGQWRMTSQRVAFVRAASFLKGYVEGEAVEPGYSGSYVEEKGYLPAGLGVVTCNVRWSKDSRGRAGGLTVRVQE